MYTRIEQLIKSLAISPSQFADEINVQRSSVSHVLSGRNKPSLDFVTKIIMRYPELSTDWLISGRGGMYSSEEGSFEGQNDDQASLNLHDEPEDTKMLESLSGKTSEAKVEIKKAERASVPSGKGSLEKIVFFYSDGHFREYKP